MGQLIPGGWTAEQSDALKTLISAGHSYSAAATRINGEFGTKYSRNAAIGRASRMGLITPVKPPQPRKARMYKPRERNSTITRIVRANGNSNAMRVLTVTEHTAYKLRCIEIVPLHKMLLDLESGDCRQPYGDSPFTFCGHPAKAGSSYCMPHHALNWAAPRILTAKAPAREVA